MTGPGSFSVKVAGNRHYQRALEKICGGRAEQRNRYELEAVLIPEDDHPHACKVVRVFIEDRLVGHLCPERSDSFQRSLAAVAPKCSAAKCPAIVVSRRDSERGDREHVEVMLDLPTV